MQISVVLVIFILKFWTWGLPELFSMIFLWYNLLLSSLTQSIINISHQLLRAHMCQSFPLSHYASQQCLAVGSSRSPYRWGTRALATWLSRSPGGSFTVLVYLAVFGLNVRVGATPVTCLHPRKAYQGIPARWPIGTVPKVTLAELLPLFFLSLPPILTEEVLLLRARNDLSQLALGLPPR